MFLAENIVASSETIGRSGGFESPASVLRKYIRP